MHSKYPARVRVWSVIQGVVGVAVRMPCFHCYSCSANTIGSGVLYDETLYFHYLPQAQLGEDRRQWGYWSLSENPNSDTVLDNEPKIDGFELSRW